jgi:hypothetical protein
LPREAGSCAVLTLGRSTRFDQRLWIHGQQLNLKN